MSESRTYVIEQDDTLGPAGEEEWRRLRQQLEFAHGFWLGFIFSPSPLAVAVLRRRTEQLLRMHAHLVRTVRPATPDDLRTALPILFGPQSAEVGCWWSEAVHADPSTGLSTSPGPWTRRSSRVPILSQTSTGLSTSPGPWTAAWDDFLLRVNERRDALRRHLQGGLVLAAPPAIKARARNAAPDLWSVRSLVLEIQPVAAQATAEPTSDDLRSHEEPWRNISIETIPDTEFALQEARRREQHAHSNPKALGAALLRAVEGLLGEGRTREAVEFANKAVDVLKNTPFGGDTDSATALTWLSQAEEADGDLAAAADHIERATHIRRQALKSAGETLQTLRDLSVSLERLGEVRHESGDRTGAAAAYEESLALRRRLLENFGETPQTLRDLSVSLNKIGEVRHESGDRTGAAAAYEESLALARRLLENFGETPQTLRDLSVSLDRLGDMCQATGDQTGAAAAYEEELQLDRQLLRIYGETLRTLGDLQVSLKKFGDIRRNAGDLSAAEAAEQERGGNHRAARSPDGEKRSDST